MMGTPGKCSPAQARFCGCDHCPCGQPGKNDGLEVSDGAVEIESVCNQRQAAVKVATVADALPELGCAQDFFRRAGVLAEKFECLRVEIGQHAIAI